MRNMTKADFKTLIDPDRKQVQTLDQLQSVFKNAKH